MVSFWPWKGDDVSPASFEKALSAQATKISKTLAKLERTRSTARRLRVLSTLYLSFAYLVYAIVLVLVVGWQNMGPLEWSGFIGGPVVIYSIRTILDIYYNFRIDSLTTNLKDYQAERAKTIQKLKDATKYNSTLELLEKYGDAEPKHGKGNNSAVKLGGSDGASEAGHGRPSTSSRTNIPPPATANIPRTFQQPVANNHHAPPTIPAELDVSAEFAPNAFGPEELPSVDPSAPILAPALGPAPAQSIPIATHHWYDRVLDLLMGEDETAAKNRIVLICSSCRLVNGQAPPGMRSLAEVGSWRCMGCGASNGEAAEAKRIVSEVLGNRRSGDKTKTTTDSNSEPSGGEEVEDAA